MRKFLFAILIGMTGLNSHRVLADEGQQCPNLVGNFQCVVHNSVSDIEVIQEDVIKYTFKAGGYSSYHIADGVWYPADPEATQGLEEAQIRSICKDGVLEATTKGLQAKTHVPQVIVNRMSLDANKDMINWVKQKIGNFSLPAIEITCSRQ